jgi:hypothetical protein
MLVAILLLITFLLGFLKMFIKEKYGRSTSKPVKGLCYFDIDGTLTTAQGDPDELVQACFDNDFAVGIATASNRKISDICNGDIPKEGWVPSLLCKQFNRDGKMYNSLSQVAGKTHFPVAYPYQSSYGYKKGFNMKYGRDNFYKDVPDKCVVLFDDNPEFIRGVKHFNARLSTQCANKTCGIRSVLNKDVVLQKLTELRGSGCV